MLPYLFLARKVISRVRSRPAGRLGRATQEDGSAVPGPTPYLGLGARLSQTWVNKWTVLLLLVLARMLIAIISLRSDINSAKREALSACSSVENVGSTLASMPHYLAGGVNELTASGVEKAVKGFNDVMMLSVTGAEEIVVFAINTLTSTYLCLITLAVGGSLHAAIDLTEDITGWLNKTTESIGQDLATGVSDFNSGLNSAINFLDKALPNQLEVKPINLSSSITELQNLEIPTSFYADLQTLNNSIPCFAEVQNLTNTAIRFPFEEIKKLMNESLGVFEFNRSVLHVPAKESLTFCSDNSEIDKFFEDLFDVARIGQQIAIIVLCILAVLACIPMAYREYRSWKVQRQRSRLISTSNYDNMDVVYIVSRPYTSTAGMRLADNVSSNHRQTLIRWVVAYVTTVPALFVLCLGLAGLFSCLCQYILLHAVEREVPHILNEVVGFEDKVLYALGNASVEWANVTNGAILDVNNKINSDLFGWVNTSTHALNNTLNTFVDETTKVLNETFGGTVLYQPITGVFNCLIELKIAGIQKALTWISDNAYVDFPLLPNNTFTSGVTAADIDSSTGNSTGTGSSNLFAHAQATAGDSITSAVTSLEKKLADGIKTEVYISSVVVGVWVILLLIALSRAAYLWFRHDDDSVNNHNNDNDSTAGGIPLDPLEKVPPRSYPTNPFADAAVTDAYASDKEVVVTNGPSMTTSFQPPPPTSPTRLRPMPSTMTSGPNKIDSALALSPSASASTLNSKGSSATMVSSEAGNTYRGVPYTLTPAPLRIPISMPAPAPVTVMRPADVPTMPYIQEGDGNVGYVQKRSVDLTKPKVNRVSSYADLAGPGVVTEGGMWPLR